MVNGEALGVNGPSQAAIGRALNLSPAAITKLKQQGMPVDSAEAAQRWRQERQNVAQRKPAPPSVAPAPSRPPSAPAPAPQAQPDEYLHGESHDAARTRREIAEADLAELKLSELSGVLVRVSDVRNELAKRLAATRESLMQIPARLSPVLAAEVDQARIHDLIQQDLQVVLQQLWQGQP
jgi:phage terminase Nu1 subunit (DNA packaging protein)